ncbi:hypothetical protein C0416_05470 [bacterium]|nr:hypothetical protein [bacterium]
MKHRLLFRFISIISILIITAIVVFAQEGTYLKGMTNRFVKQFSIQKNKVIPVTKIDEQTKIKMNLEEANVAILEFAADDPGRFNGGNLNINAVINKFYSSHSNDFDMLITMDFKTDVGNNILNGWSNGTIHLKGPSNIGIRNVCSMLGNQTCLSIPSKLKYMQQCAYNDYKTNENISADCRHEILHYWGNGWHTPNADSCFDDWVSQAFENGHWTQLFSAGSVASLHSYPVNFLEAREVPPTDYLLSIYQYSTWTDNKDGTFTSHTVSPEDQGFNYIDLYQMGLLSEEELSNKDIFVVLNPEFVGYANTLRSGAKDQIFSGTRKDITIEELKSLLKEREKCEGVEQYYYSGDGSRVPEILPETALDLKVAFALIKYPEQQITMEDAQKICKIVNYDIPEDWYNSSRLSDNLRSNIKTYLSENNKNPDCESLFPIN